MRHGLYEPCHGGKAKFKAGGDGSSGHGRTLLCRNCAVQQMNTQFFQRFHLSEKGRDTAHPPIRPHPPGCATAVGKAQKNRPPRRGRRNQSGFWLWAGYCASSRARATINRSFTLTATRSRPDSLRTICIVVLQLCFKPGREPAKIPVGRRGFFSSPYPPCRATRRDTAILPAR